jgi:hypothetical protein
LEAPLAAKQGLFSKPSRSLAEAPHRGLSPIVYTLAQTQEGTAVSLSAKLGRDTLEDLLFVFGSGEAR